MAPMLHPHRSNLRRPPSRPLSRLLSFALLVATATIGLLARPAEDDSLDAAAAVTASAVAVAPAAPPAATPAR